MLVFTFTSSNQLSTRISNWGDADIFEVNTTVCFNDDNATVVVAGNS